MNHPDPRAISAAEKAAEHFANGSDANFKTAHKTGFHAGVAWRDAAGPPESPAEEDDTPPCLPGKKAGTFVGKFVPEPVSPASSCDEGAAPPPEWGFANKAAALPRLFVHEPWASQSPSASTFERPNGCKFCHEYLSVIECNAALAEAKQQGRAEAFLEVAELAKQDPERYSTVQFFAEVRALQCCPTPSKGDVDG